MDKPIELTTEEVKILMASITKNLTLLHDSFFESPLFFTGYKGINDEYAAKEALIKDMDEATGLLETRWAELSFIEFNLLNGSVANILNKFDIEDGDVWLEIVSFLVKIGSALSKKFRSETYRQD